MPTGRKLAVVLSVLVAGWSAALFFRKDASSLDSVSGVPTGGALGGLDTGEPLTRRAVTLPGQQPRPTYKTPIVAAQVAPTAAGSPQLTTRFESASRPAQAILRPHFGDDEDADAAADEPPGDDAASAAWPAEPAARTHKIVDGDTLSRLAQRYLGSADRYQQIYEANRDVLRSPDLLPIGKVLRLPDPADRSVRSPRTSAAGVSLGARGAQLDEQSAAQMVPIPQGALRIRSD